MIDGHNQPNWKSLCTPAVLPLTTDHFPQNLENDYEESNYRHDLPQADAAQDMIRACGYDSHQALIDELVCQRLSHDFQVVVVPEAGEVGPAKVRFGPQLNLNRFNRASSNATTGSEREAAAMEHGGLDVGVKHGAAEINAASAATLTGATGAALQRELRRTKTAEGSMMSGNMKGTSFRQDLRQRWASSTGPEDAVATGVVSSEEQQRERLGRTGIPSWSVAAATTPGAPQRVGSSLHQRGPSGGDGMGETTQGARLRARTTAKAALQAKQAKQAKAKIQRRNDAMVGKTVYHLSMGHKIHAITFDKVDKSIQVKLYVKKESRAMAATSGTNVVQQYNFMLFLDTVGAFTACSLKFQSVAKKHFGWNELDEVICGYEDELMTKLNPKMIHFMIMPFTPRSSTSPTAATSAPSAGSATHGMRHTGMPGLSRNNSGSVSSLASTDNLSGLGRQPSQMVRSDSTASLGSMGGISRQASAENIAGRPDRADSIVSVGSVSSKESVAQGMHRSWGSGVSTSRQDSLSGSSSGGWSNIDRQDSITSAGGQPTSAAAAGAAGEEGAGNGGSGAGESGSVSGDGSNVDGAGSSSADKQDEKDEQEEQFIASFKKFIALVDSKVCRLFSINTFHMLFTHDFLIALTIFRGLPGPTRVSP
jgi:hypothetical protein